MLRTTHCFIALTAAFVFALASGCGHSGTSDRPGKGGKTDTKSKGGAGAHPEHGPHGGDLVELGNEEYHAEVLHDETAGTVTIYVLDSSAKKAVPVEAKELTINVRHKGKGEQHKLAASPETGDPQGKSSRFVSNDKHLHDELEAEGVQAELTVAIGGKQYRGKVEHHHHDEKK